MKNAKKYIHLLIIPFLAITTLLSSCDSSGKADNQKLLEQAYTLNDLNTAIIAAQQLYLEDEVRNAYLLDTLISLYNRKSADLPIIKLAEKNKGEFNNYNTLMSISLSQSNLDLMDESISTLQKCKQLFPEKSIAINYELAQIHYKEKEADKANNLLDKIISKPDSRNQKVAIFFSQGEQSVSYAAAAYNMKGIIALQEKEWDEAETALDKALELAPHFQLAKNNQALLNKAREQTH